MSDLAVVRRVSTDQLERWRREVIHRTEGGTIQRDEGRVRLVDREGRFEYGRSPAIRAKAPEVPVDQDGGVEFEVPVYRPREAREVRDRLMERKLAGIERLMAMNPEAKREIIQHLRQTRPHLLGHLTDDEAYRQFDQVVQREMEEATKRALVTQGRDATVMYGG